MYLINILNDLEGQIAHPTENSTPSPDDFDKICHSQCKGIGHLIHQSPSHLRLIRH